MRLAGALGRCWWGGPAAAHTCVDTCGPGVRLSTWHLVHLVGVMGVEKQATASATYTTSVAAVAFSAYHVWSHKEHLSKLGLAGAYAFLLELLV